MPPFLSLPPSIVSTAPGRSGPPDPPATWTLPRIDAQVEPLTRIGRYYGSDWMEIAAQIEAQDAIFRGSDPDRQ